METPKLDGSTFIADYTSSEKMEDTKALEARIRDKNPDLDLSISPVEGLEIRKDEELGTAKAKVVPKKPKELGTWDLIKAVMPNSKRVLLYGPPGTGKTYSGNHLGKKTYNITITEDMSVGELWGHFVPNGDKFAFSYGPAARAWIDGACLVINEIDNASGPVETALHAVLDDPEFATYSLNTTDDLGNTRIETLKPNAGFCCVATMNGLPEDLPDALRDRFPVKIHVERPCKEAILALPKEYRKVIERSYSGNLGPNSLTFRSVMEFSLST